VTIQRFGANTIDYATAPFVLTMRGEAVHMIDDGSGNWIVK
jgi:hypothetical protein